MLVEGVSDQYFFEEYLRKIDVIARVRITAPKDHGSEYNNKGGVLATLPLLIKQLGDGSLTHLAVVVDADHASNDGMGFGRTLEYISQQIHDDGYNQRERVGEGGGFCFRHNDGLNPIGFWIMPDNASEGGLEELAIRSAVDDEEKALIYAEKILGRIPSGGRFKKNHLSKAQAAAWMSWQEKPGQGLQQAVRSGLIDLGKPLTVSLTAWLRRIFP